jgi:catechol 2,3-dioxygenase-like lactoylglutathione lyase family enzyme
MARRKAARAKRPAKKARSTARPAKTAGPRRAAATPQRRRRREPETLRLRAIEPSFTVNDLDRSVRFYTDVLGFILGDRWEDKGVLKGVMLKAGACGLGLSQDDWSKGRDRRKGEGMSIWLRTAQDLDAIAGRIRSGGGSFEGPKTESWGGRSLSVVDPDGFRLTLYEEPPDS